MVEGVRICVGKMKMKPKYNPPICFVISFFFLSFLISTTAALRGDEDKIRFENIVKDGLCICSKDKKLRHQVQVVDRRKNRRGLRNLT